MNKTFFDKKAFFSSALGSTLQWFNYAILSALAPLMVKLFVSDSPIMTSLVSTLYIYTSPLLARPLGSIAIGNFADIFGRRLGIILTLLLMSIAILTLGVSPTFGMVGFIAPAFLLILRTLHALSSGAEYPTISTFLAESAPENKRYFYTSLIFSFQFFGMILGLAAVSYVALGFSTSSFVSYGWRVPFIISGILGLLGTFLRKQLSETKPFLNIKKSPLWHHHSFSEALRKSKKQIFIVFGLACLDTPCYSFFIARSLNYFPDPLEPQSLYLSFSNLAGLVCALIVAPFFGKLAHKIGAVRQMLIGSILLLLLVYPLTIMLNGNVPSSSVFANILLAALTLLYIAPLGCVIALLFPIHWRVSCFAITHSVGISLFSAIIPLLLHQILPPSPQIIPCYVTICAIVGVIACTYLYRNQNELFFKE